MDYVVKHRATDLGANLWKKLFEELGMVGASTEYSEIHLHVKDVELFPDS